MKTTGSKQLVFLTYLRRSGSTYLCQMLHQQPDVGVSLEGTFLDGVIAPCYEPDTDDQLNGYLKLLYDDQAETPSLREISKFRYWGIDQDVLRSELRQRLPVSVEQLLKTALGLYFRDTTANTWVYKNGNYVWHIPRLRSMYPDAKFVFIMRDPRAVYQSQVNTVSSNTGEPMCSNPFIAANLFRRAARIVDQLRDAPWFHCVRYEQLIECPAGELQRVLDFLNVKQASINTSASYYERIPVSQKHLHPNITAEPKRERIQAWQQSIDAGDQAIIEMVVGSYLQRFGYQPGFGTLGRISKALRKTGHWIDCGRRIYRRNRNRQILTLPAGLQSSND